MAIAEMQKVHLAVHKSVADELTGKLQALGCCQFIAQSHEKVDERDIAPLRARLRKIEDLLGEARFVSRFLEPFATEKGSGLARAMGDLPEYSLKELGEIADEKKFLQTVSQLRDLEKRISDVRSGISRVAGLRAQLEPLASLPYSLDFYSVGTDAVLGGIYAVPTASVEAFKQAMSKALGDMVDIHALPVGEKDTAQVFSLIYAKECATLFQDTLSGFQTTRTEVPPQMSNTAAGEIARLDEELAELKMSEDVVTKEISDMANAAYRQCQLFSDYWTIQKDQAISLLEGEQTEQIALMGFWIPKGRCLEAFKKIAAPYQDLMEVMYVEPDEDERIPTLLRNPGWSAPMEALTSMYGTPTYGKLDPTTVMTPFFYLFFGMCFGDAGYGLLISSLLISLLLRKHVTGILRQFMIILIIGNVVSVIYGALTFSWFGDSITAFPFLKTLMPLGKLQILDPMNDPMTLLSISLVLGFFQLMVGLVLAMKENLDNGDKFAAFADQGGWMIFLCGLVLFGLGFTSAIAIAGALILVATQGREKNGIIGKLMSGVLSLYNVTGYLGDVLSYSRLLALGLGSAAVGMVINLLATLVSDIPVIGIPVAILVFVGGHIFGIAVNMLGAFVHSLRLQYVEFFGKFYVASGEEFTPLSMSPQYVKLSDLAEKA